MTSGGELIQRPDRRPAHARGSRQQAVALIDLLDRLLDGGVTIHGQVILSVADVDLVQLDLRLLVSSVDKAAGRK